MPKYIVCGLADDIEHVFSGFPSFVESLRCATSCQVTAVLAHNHAYSKTAELLEAWRQERNPGLNDVLYMPLHRIRYPSVRSPDRGRYMGRLRNELLQHLLSQHQLAADDVVLMADADVMYIDTQGALASIALLDKGYAYLGSNGLMEKNGAVIQYDVWAYRTKTLRPLDKAIVNRLVPPANAEPVPLRSCFGGLAVYKGRCVTDGIRYDAQTGDCEHVRFADNCSVYGTVALNPGQRVFYNFQPPQKD